VSLLKMVRPIRVFSPEEEESMFLRNVGIYLQIIANSLQILLCIVIVVHIRTQYAVFLSCDRTVRIGTAIMTLCSVFRIQNEVYVNPNDSFCPK
jgi:hypothetical protein